MFPEKTISQIKFEIKQIDKLLRAYEELFNKCQDSEPELIEITALASVLHSFYNGIEKIFEIIAKRIDKAIPQGKQWHRDLLIQMAKDLPSRKPVISKNMMTELLKYLAFRHFYRHSYSFFLSWEELEKLVNSIFDVWESLKTEISFFMDG
ncbi:MAG TPA: hypothetical protein PK733_14575 [Clostridiales bacterium]|nr:hypothetical protein [Clostridiales bacterium]